MEESLHNEPQNYSDRYRQHKDQYENLKKKEKWQKTQDSKATCDLEAQQYKNFYKHNNVKYSRYKLGDGSTSENKKSSSKKMEKEKELLKTNNKI